MVAEVGRVVADQDLVQRLGRCRWCDGVGSDQVVGVAVADDPEVEVVGVPATGQHRIELLPRFPASEHPVHGVGRYALGTMNCGRVAETYGRPDIIGGQSADELTPQMADGDVATRADLGDGPPVAVPNEVGGGGAESAVVGAGDDHVADGGLVSIGELDFAVGVGGGGCVARGLAG